MSQTISVWSVVLASLFAANVPFLTRRFLLFILLKNEKSILISVFELLVFYFSIGIFAIILENHRGQIAPQTWEFYVVTGTLFITFAFPGFVYRYLLKHR